MQIMTVPNTGLATVMCTPVHGGTLHLTAPEATGRWLADYAALVSSPDCQAEAVKVTAYCTQLNFYVADFGHPLALLEGAASGNRYVLFLDISGKGARIMCYQIAPDFVEIDLDTSSFTPVP